MTNIMYRLVAGTWLELEQNLWSALTSQLTGVCPTMPSHQMDDSHCSNLYALCHNYVADEVEDDDL